MVHHPTGLDRHVQDLYPAFGPDLKAAQCEEELADRVELGETCRAAAPGTKSAPHHRVAERSCVAPVGTGRRHCIPRVQRIGPGSARLTPEDHMAARLPGTLP